MQTLLGVLVHRDDDGDRHDCGVRITLDTDGSIVRVIDMDGRDWTSLLTDVSVYHHTRKLNAVAVSAA